MFSSPTVVGSLLIVGSCSGKLYALDGRTGAVRWSYDIRRDGDQTSFHGDPLVAGDLIVIGTDNGSQGHVYAFEKETGRVRWKYPVRTGAGGDIGAASDIVRRGRYLYLVAQGDQMLCLTLEGGQVQWTFSSTFDPKHFSWSNSPAIDHGHVFFAGLDGWLYALNSESGSLLWKKNLHAVPSTSPVILRGSIYVGTKDGNLHKLRVIDGSFVRSIALNGSPWRHLEVSRGALFALLVRNIQIENEAGFSPNTLVSVRLDLSRVSWLRNCPSPSDPWTSARPYIQRGEVFAGDYKGRLFAFQRKTGSLLWSYQFPSRTIRGVGLVKGSFYVGTIQGMVYAAKREGLFLK